MKVTPGLNFGEVECSWSAGGNKVKGSGIGKVR